MGTSSPVRFNPTEQFFLSGTGASSSSSSSSSSTTHTLPHATPPPSPPLTPPPSPPSTPLAPEIIRACDEIWKQILTREDSEPHSSRPLRIHFYLLCYEYFHQNSTGIRRDEHSQVNTVLYDINSDHHLPPLPPPASPHPPQQQRHSSTRIHNIMTFMLKMIDLYLNSLESDAKFDKHLRFLVLSCVYLRISPRDFDDFELAYILTVEKLFDKTLSIAWKQLLQDIFSLVLLEYQRQAPRRSHTSICLPPTQEPQPDDLMISQASLAWNFVLSIQEEAEDPNSVHARLMTSLQV